MSNQATAVQAINAALGAMNAKQVEAVKAAGETAANAALVATAVAAATSPENPVAAAENLASSVVVNSKQALKNATNAAPSQPSKSLAAAIRCITKKSDRGFYQLARSYPCPPTDLPDGTKKGSITEGILNFFDGKDHPNMGLTKKNTVKLTKSVKAYQPAVASRLLKVLKAHGYEGGRRTRRNRKSRK